MMRKSFAVTAVAVVAVGLGGCAGTVGSSSGGATAGQTTLNVAAFEGGYGKDMYTKVVQAYEALNPSVHINLKVSKTIAEELTPQVAAGNVPDVVVLGQGGKAGFTESFVRDKNLADLTGVLDMTVPGETDTVRSKLTDGIIGNLNTDPYADGKTYLMPMYASPTGLVYDAGLFKEKGWTVPTTWDEMFALGDKAKKDGISLFTYPTSGYLDSYFYSLLATVGGPDFYTKVMTYQPNIWETPQAQQALTITTKLLKDYSNPQTVGYANDQDFTKNQQSILSDKTLFMPNGAWIPNEMKDGPRPSTFAWGIAPVPAMTTGAQQYINTSVESAWVPAKAKHLDEAKKFVAFLYSDKAAGIFAQTNAIQPIKGLAAKLTGDAKTFYAAYDQPNVKALVGGFAATTPVAGVDIKSALFDSANGVITGSISEQQWQQLVNTASNKLTGAVQK